MCRGDRSGADLGAYDLEVETDGYSVEPHRWWPEAEGAAVWRAEGHAGLRNVPPEFTSTWDQWLWPYSEIRTLQTSLVKSRPYWRGVAWNRWLVSSQEEGNADTGLGQGTL